MTVYENRIRRAYGRRRTVGEMAIFALFCVAVLALLAVAACEQEEPPALDRAEAERRAEVVRRWYAEMYPAYGVVGR